ncbi:MAG: type II toxin-antitoxin system HicB family antitoxin [Gemmatimonadales bacterium]
MEVDDEANLLHGQIVNTRDVITFQGRTVKELRRALEDSIEDYLEFCEERGEAPEKPFSGKFMVRIDPALHRDLTLTAAVVERSVQAVVREALESVVQSMNVVVRHTADVVTGNSGRKTAETSAQVPSSARKNVSRVVRGKPARKPKRVATPLK